MLFGTVLVTKDRNQCLTRTLRALLGSDLLAYPVVVLNNGSEVDSPQEVIQRLDFPCEYIDVGFNPGIVGSRVLAHRVAISRSWTHYCFLQDDFELRAEGPWLADTLEFVSRFQIDYCRLTVRESVLGENEHWVKGVLREQSGEARWNCSHIQQLKHEQIGKTGFAITDKHYGDWVHIMSAPTSLLLFGDNMTRLDGPSVSELVLQGQPWKAFAGALRTEFDIATKHWLAYAGGLSSATGLVMEQPSWSGLFDHFEAESASGRRELPERPQDLARIAEGWTPKTVCRFGSIAASPVRNARPVVASAEHPAEWIPPQWT